MKIENIFKLLKDNWQIIGGAITGGAITVLVFIGEIIFENSVSKAKTGIEYSLEDIKEQRKKIIREVCIKTIAIGLFVIIVAILLPNIVMERNNIRNTDVLIDSSIVFWSGILCIVLCNRRFKTFILLIIIQLFIWMSLKDIMVIFIMYMIVYGMIYFLGLSDKITILEKFVVILISIFFKLLGLVNPNKKSEYITISERYKSREIDKVTISFLKLIGTMYVCIGMCLMLACIRSNISNILIVVIILYLFCYIANKIYVISCLRDNVAKIYYEDSNKQKVYIYRRVNSQYLCGYKKYLKSNNYEFYEDIKELERSISNNIDSSLKGEINKKISQIKEYGEYSCSIKEKVKIITSSIELKKEEEKFEYINSILDTLLCDLKEYTKTTLVKEDDIIGKELFVVVDKD